MIIAALLLLPGALVAATGGEAQTENVAPVVGVPKFYTSAPSASSTCPAGDVTSFDPTAGATTTVHVCVVVTDDNGWSDVCQTGSARTFDVTTNAGVVLATDKDDEALTCATGSGTDVGLTGSFTMEYWRPDVLIGAGYKVVATATDVASASDSETGLFAYTALTALDQATHGTINLGTALSPGEEAPETAVALYNDGNQAFTITIDGDLPLTGGLGETIAIGNVKWDESAATAYASKTAVTSTATSTTVSAPAETSATPTARNVYLQLTVPTISGSTWIPADTWTTTITFGTV